MSEPQPQSRLVPFARTRIQMAHDCPPLAEQIRDSVPLIQSYLDDGRISYQEFCGFGVLLSHAACRVFSAGQTPGAHAEEVATAAEYVWDRWIAPLDVYGVPDSLEAVIKPIVRAAIRPAVNRMMLGS